MIVAGFGFRNGVTDASLMEAFARTGHSGDVAAVATAEGKATDPGLAALAASLRAPIRAIDHQTLAQQDTQTHSDASRAAYGTGSLAEAAALAAAGAGGRLLGARVTSSDGMATCALAEGAET